MARNFGTNDRMLRYKRIKSHFFTDTFFVTDKAKSTRGNTCMQLFVSDKGFVAVYPMVAVKEYIHALRQFAKDVGAPEVLVADLHPTQKKKEVKAFLRIDGENKNTFWMDALRKEMGNVGIAFKIQPAGVKAPPGWTKASGHIIWDVKMSFERKARWVKRRCNNLQLCRCCITREHSHRAHIRCPPRY